MKAQYSTVNQEQQRGEELDRRVSKEVAMAGDRGQSVQEVRDKARDIAGAMRDQGVGASAMPLPSDDSARGSYVESIRRHNASAIGR